MESNVLYQENIADIIETHGDSKYAENPINLEWANGIHAGQDAKFLLRRRSLLSDLWHFITPEIMRVSKNSTVRQRCRESVRQAFIEQVSEEIAALQPVRLALYPQEKKWDLDCLAVMQ